MKFEMIQIFRARTAEEKQENREIRPFFNKEENEICMNLLQLDKNADHRHEAKLPI